MTERLYSIIVPTRERADVLRYAVKTVLNLTRSNYELIVMDNCGSPQTRQVVDSFASPNIRYFRSSERLPMADNWELGLDQAAGDYITVLGDDDGVMPDALEIAERFHQRWPDGILSWLPFMWLWPDFVVPGYRNLAQMHFGNHIERFSSRSFLKDLLDSRKFWTDLPTLYCSFVPRKLIDQARSAHGRYFLASLPDVSSGITNLCSTSEFFYSYRPLSCWGSSRHSTGALQYFETDASEQLFDIERRAKSDEPWHPRILGAELIAELRIADTYLKLKERLFSDDDYLQLDMAALLRHVAGISATRFRARWCEVRQAVEEMARLNGLDPADFPVAAPSRAAPGRFGYSMNPGERNVVRYYHFTDPDKVRTIEDFIDHAGRMCVQSARMGIPESGVRPRSDRAGLLRRLGRSARELAFRRRSGRGPSCVSAALDGEAPDASRRGGLT